MVKDVLITYKEYTEVLIKTKCEFEEVLVKMELLDMDNRIFYIYLDYDFVSERVTVNFQFVKSFEYTMKAHKEIIAPLGKFLTRVNECRWNSAALNWGDTGPEEGQLLQLFINNNERFDTILELETQEDIELFLRLTE